MKKSIEELLKDAVHSFMDIHKIDKLLIFPDSGGFTLEATPPENASDIKELFEGIVLYMLDNGILRMLFKIESGGLSCTEVTPNTKRRMPTIKKRPYTVMPDIEKTLCLPTKNAKSLI